MPRGGDHYSGFDGGDDGLDDDEDLDRANQADDAGADRDNELEVTSTSTPDESQSQESTSPNEIPHRVRYDSPKDGRDHAKTLVFTGEDKKRLSELETMAETEFDEEVYRLDVYLASLRAGIHSDDEQFLEEMRTIGYGYFE